MAARRSSSKVTECPVFPFISGTAVVALPSSSSSNWLSIIAGAHRSEAFPASPRVTLIPFPRCETKAIDPGISRRPPGVHAAPSAIRAALPPPAGRGLPSSTLASRNPRPCLLSSWPSMLLPKDICESNVRESIAPRILWFSSLGLALDRRPALDPAARPSRRLSKEPSRPSLGGWTSGWQMLCWSFPATGPVVIAVSPLRRLYKSWLVGRLGTCWCWVGA